jgi:membrane protein
VFSVGPLMVIAIGIAGLAFGQEAARGEVQGQLSGMVGQPAADAIDSILVNANKPQQGVLSSKTPSTRCGRSMKEKSAGSGI